MVKAAGPGRHRAGFQAGISTLHPVPSFAGKEPSCHGHPRRADPARKLEAVRAKLRPVREGGTGKAEEEWTKKEYSRHSIKQSMGGRMYPHELSGFRWPDPWLPGKKGWVFPPGCRLKWEATP